MQGGSSKLKTKSQGHKAFVQSRNMPTKAVRTLKKGLETGQRRAGDKEIKSQLRGEALEELTAGLALSLFDEDWKKKEAKLAAEHPKGRFLYHDEKASHHKERQTIYSALADAAARHPDIAAKHNLAPEKEEYYRQKAVRHRRLASAHTKMSSGPVDLTPEPKSPPFTSSGKRNTWVPLPSGVTSFNDWKGKK